jgi:hypothetical protein
METGEWRSGPWACGVVVSALALFSCNLSRDAKPRDPELTKTQLFDLRTKCSDLMRRAEQDYEKQEKQYGLEAAAPATFTNHYDPIHNRCYVEEIDSRYQTTQRGDGNTTNIRTVFDAQQGNPIAACIQFIRDKERSPKEPGCSGPNNETITLSKANDLMNQSMAESLTWP